MTKREFKKYRKDALKEIHYQSVYADGVIETKQGYFTKTYVCNCDVMQIFDQLHKLYTESHEDGLNKLDAQLTYYNKVFYITFGVAANSYELGVEVFNKLDVMQFVRPLSFAHRMKLLHAMYQNDDDIRERFSEFSYRKPKKGEIEPVLPDLFDESFPVADRLKNFKKNRKTSKDLILPMEMKNGPTEFEFEGNYIRFFYLKNMPRYLTKDFIEDLMFMENVFFSMHLKPLNQSAIVEYVEEKYEGVKELKESELIQRNFFDAAIPELNKSAKRGEEMFLVTLVLGLPNDSIDELDAKIKKMTRDMEETYVLKVLKFQQRDALNTALPLCNDKLDIQTTIYKMREKIGG